MTNEKVARALLPVLVGAGCMISFLSVMNALAEWKDATPRVGDIVSFLASTRAPIEDGARLVAHRPDQFGCVLDVNTLRRTGGSLIVEGQISEAAASFRVHWAGERTTADASNCGDNADLILDVHQLDVLASSAGGYNNGARSASVFDYANGT